MSEEDTTPSAEDTVEADTEPKRRGRPPKQQADLSDVLAGMTEIAKAVNVLSESQRKLVEDVERLKNPSLPPPPEDLEPPALPDGTVRFFSPKKEYQIGVEDEISIIADGRVVRQKITPGKVSQGSTTARMIHFQDHIRDFHLPEDEAVVEYLMNHPDYGVDFVIDSSAIARTTRAKVVEGTRGMKPEHQPAPSLEATF